MKKLMVIALGLGLVLGMSFAQSGPSGGAKKGSGAPKKGSAPAPKM